MSKRLAVAAELEQRLAALQGEEWNSEDEEEEEKNDAANEALMVLPQALELDLASKRKTKNETGVKLEDGMSSVIYVGHIPHGFYEEQMRGFFTQFGDVERVRLSRSKKTGGSKGYAFVEFKDSADTKIVAEAMDKYLLVGKQLVVKQLRTNQVHARIWKGANQKFRPYPRREQHGARVNKPKSEEEQQAVNARLVKKEEEKRKQLEALGIDYSFPGYSATLRKEASAPEAAPVLKKARSEQKTTEKAPVVLGSAQKPKKQKTPAKSLSAPEKTAPSPRSSLKPKKTKTPAKVLSAKKMKKDKTPK